MSMTNFTAADMPGGAAQRPVKKAVSEAPAKKPATRKTPAAKTTEAPAKVTPAAAPATVEGSKAND